MNQFKIVAHRGFAGKYPENTMAAMRGAVEMGMHYVELDVQLSSDLVPILFHDDTLDRTTAASGSVLDTAWSELSVTDAGEPKRFADQFSDEKIPNLEEFLAWLQTQSQVHAFIEIKDESLHKHGYETMLDKIVPLCSPVKDQITIIGYDLNFLINARDHGFGSIGWVLSRFNEQEKIQAMHHQPDFIVCNYQKVNGELWSGSWRWMLYEIATAELAREWASLGTEFIETMEVEKLVSGLDKEEWTG
jgi:glycerophosphoryl diester phosphodiesterase